MALNQLHNSESVCALRLDVPLIGMHVPAFFGKLISLFIALDLFNGIASSGSFFSSHVSLDPSGLGNFVSHGIDGMPEFLVGKGLGNTMLNYLKPL